MRRVPTAFLLAASVALAAPPVSPVLPAVRASPPAGNPVPVRNLPDIATTTRTAIRVGGTPVPGAALIGPSVQGSGGGSTSTLTILPAGVSSAARPSTPTPAVTTGLTEWLTITVRPGDTLSGLARQYRTSVTELQRVNTLTGSALRAGQALRVPEHLCGVVTCEQTAAGTITAPDGTTLTRNGTQLTLSTTGNRTLWPELGRVWLSGVPDHPAILAALITACQAPRSLPLPPQVRCVNSATVALLRTP